MSIVLLTDPLCAQGVAAVVTGSGSMMSEAIHSAVDVMNQGLLAIGLARGNQKPNLKNPCATLRVWTDC